MKEKDNKKSRGLNLGGIVNILCKITPDLVKVIEDRYKILRTIYYLQPVGRRTLSNRIGLSERNIRTEVSLLKEQGLIEITSEGMNITIIGKDIVEKLNDFFHAIRGLKKIEEDAKRILNIKKVIVVPGSVEEDPLVLREIGKIGAIYLRKVLKNDIILGLTGGTTVASVVEEYEKVNDNLKNITIIPARGGLGKKVEYQANTLVQKLADKIGCNYKSLYTPDYLSQNIIQSLKAEPTIKEILDLIKEIDVLMFGIGRADVMARRRGLSEEEIENLLGNGAVSEAFGYYFNEFGEIVYEISTIGISLNKFQRMENAIAVAAGKGKTEAIISVCKLNKNLVLITDEGVANKIILKYKEGELNDC